MFILPRKPKFENKEFGLRIPELVMIWDKTFILSGTCIHLS